MSEQLQDTTAISVGAVIPDNVRDAYESLNLGGFLHKPNELCAKIKRGDVPHRHGMNDWRHPLHPSWNILRAHLDTATARPGSRPAPKEIAPTTYAGATDFVIAKVANFRRFPENEQEASPDRMMANIKTLARSYMAWSEDGVPHDPISHAYAVLNDEIGLQHGQHRHRSANYDTAEIEAEIQQDFERVVAIPDAKGVGFKRMLTVSGLIRNPRVVPAFASLAKFLP